MTSTRVTPQEAWETLIEGNSRFIAGTHLNFDGPATRVPALVNIQAPNAAFLGCSDSRVAAELLFDCGLGELFVVRNIGQIANENTVATMEFAVDELGVAVLVVLAHTSCGAVAAAIDQAGANPPPVTPAIERELARIQPSVLQEWLRVPRETPYVDPTSVNADRIGRRHLVNTINSLMSSSRVISDAVAGGDLAIVGCQYALEDGVVVPLVWVGQVDIEFDDEAVASL